VFQDHIAFGSRREGCSDNGAGEASIQRLAAIGDWTARVLPGSPSHPWQEVTWDPGLRC